MLGHTAYIALGSNLANPIDQVLHAFMQLENLPQTRLLARSSLYASAPVGYLDQPDFINAVAALETHLAPLALLTELQALEYAQGRARSFANAPRTLDLDLLLYDDWQMDSPTLSLPHPRLLERAFVLLPLAEIVPSGTIPVHGTLTPWLAACADQPILRLETPASCP